MIFKQFIIIFLFKYVFCNDTQEINVGTVLFTSSDNTKKCWSNEELALIRSRMVFQDLLPKCTMLSMENDAFVSALIQYFKMAVERTKKMTAGKVREINMKALTDTLGGYLHHIVLPLGKHAYYAGKICYDSAEQLYKLYDEMKSYLMTDGQGWAPPITPAEKAKRDAEPLPQPPPESGKDSCANLIYTHTMDGGIQIPMPFLDSKTNPSSIAVPYKDYPLRNLRSKSSAYVLIQFYETAIACLQEKHASQDQINKFSNDLNLFIETEIMPHMSDEDLFPAFGSVYRLKGTLEGLTPTGNTLNSLATESDVITSGSTTAEYEKDEDHSSTIIFIAISVVILIWLLTGVVYCCCRMRRKRRGHDAHVLDVAALRTRSSSKAASGPGSVKSGAVHRGQQRGKVPESYGSRRDEDRGAKKECKAEKRNKEISKQPSEKAIHDTAYNERSRNPFRAPIDHSPKTPNKTPNKTPTKTPNKTPTKTPTRTPTDTSTKAPPPKTSPTERKSGGGLSKTSGKSDGFQCGKCHRMKCGHGSETVASVREVQSAPLKPFHPGKSNSSSRTSTKQPVVYGYNIQTSSSNSSSSESDDDYSSSSDVQSKKS